MKKTIVLYFIGASQQQCPYTMFVHGQYDTFNQVPMCLYNFV